MPLRIYSGIFFVLCFLGIAGCATVRELPSSSPGPMPQGVYHKVQKGETLWRIAKAYGLGMEEIIKSNNIPNVAQLEQNQLILIPGAETIKEIALEEDIKQDEFIWPLKGKIVSYFGERHNERFNRGIGIETNSGEIVHAARDGKVVFADYLHGYGETIILDHQDGYFTVYAHNSSLNANLGNFVLKGDPIAQVGNRGEMALLHFEIRKHSVADNPLYYLP